MALRDGLRQVLAGLLAAAVFLGLYFGLALVWFAALALAAVAYFALLLVFPRRKPLDEIMLSSSVSAADIRAAAQALLDSAKRIDASAAHVPDTIKPELEKMSGDLRSIRQHMISDPQDYRAARRFVVNYLPVVVETVENYGKLAERAGPAHKDRLELLGDTIRGFAPAIEKIDIACLENDFEALEVQVSALATQMKRG